MTPYTPAAITRLLRAMSPAALALAKPEQFQRWPATVITPGTTIRSLIANERARRAA